MKLIEDIYVGYWREKEVEESLFPLPIQDSWRPSPDGKQDFLDWLVNLLDKRSKLTRNEKRIRCKICGNRLDSSEYVMEFMRNPTHYIYVHMPHSFLHYVRKHNVRPPLNFFRTIRDKEMRNIKQYVIEICKDTFLATN